MVSEKGNVLAVERWKGEPDDVGNIEFYHEYDKEAMKVEVDGKGRIINISKEIGKWEAWGEYIGFARIEDVNKLRRAVNYLVKAGHVQDWYESALNVMVKFYKTVIHPCPLIGNERWVEIDTPEDLKIARKLFHSQE